MNIRKKGAAIGFTATLLASMIAVIAAPLASAAVTVTSAGTVPRGGTSANAATFTFTENTIACLPNAAMPGALTVTIDDINGGDVTFSGTPVVTAPGSLGATASATGNVLTIDFLGSDTANIEQVSVSGLKITAATTATAGAISATLGGTQAGCFTSATPASGSVVSGIGVGSGSVILNVGACNFEATGVVHLWGTSGNLVFAGGESIGITAAGAPGVDVAGGGVPEIGRASCRERV